MFCGIPNEMPKIQEEPDLEIRPQVPICSEDFGREKKHRWVG